MGGYGLDLGAGVETFEAYVQGCACDEFVWEFNDGGLRGRGHDPRLRRILACEKWPYIDTIYTSSYAVNGHVISRIATS